MGCMRALRAAYDVTISYFWGFWLESVHGTVEEDGIEEGSEGCLDLGRRHGLQD